jgi:hypothetical protein
MTSGARGSAGVALVFLTFAVVALVGGTGYALVVSVGGPGAATDHASATPTVSGSASAEVGAATTGANAPAGSQRDREDALAAAPMVQLPRSAPRPQPLATVNAGPPIDVPAPTGGIAPGGAPFATGFPHTPEGALGQLAAIDEAALNRIDLGWVHTVYSWAAKPGAVAETDWVPAAGVTAVIKELGGADRVAGARMTFRVVQGQLTGSVGPDFVVACVLGETTVTAAAVGRGGAGDCQRMVWSDGRWWIGPGAQPARAPSAWPGSADAVRAGWRVINRAQ